MKVNGRNTEKGGYFEARCRIVATYREELLKADLFDAVVSELLLKAGTFDD